MQLRIGLLTAAVLSLVSACESGWDLEGRVMTAGAPDKNRPLYVYLVDAATIDPTALGAGADSIDYSLAQKAALIPSDELAFETHAFGCHLGSVAAVAWAPAGGAPPLDRPPFKPSAGDYVAVSDVRHPYCGFMSHPESVVLVLDGRAYP